MNSTQYQELWRGLSGNLSRLGSRLNRYRNRKKIHLTEPERQKINEIEGKIWEIERELSDLLSPRAGKKLLEEATSGT